MHFMVILSFYIILLLFHNMRRDFFENLPGSVYFSTADRLDSGDGVCMCAYENTYITIFLVSDVLPTSDDAYNDCSQHAMATVPTDIGWDCGRFTTFCTRS